MLLTKLSNGDRVYRYNKSIVVFFSGRRKILSTSIYNGGYHEDYEAVYNHDCKQGAGMPCEMLAPTYEEHMRLISQRLSLNPNKVSGMGTAADMENVAIVSDSYKELTVTAIITGGIETNGGRVGDPADYYKPIPKTMKPGTINIMLLLDCDLPAGTLARALVTCTEAKTAAIQELMAGSNYSWGLATGSGTDQTIIMANADSGLYLEGAGKHSKLGELIGRVVKMAVKAALSKQSNLNPASQHDVLRRLKRFGISSDSLWKQYQKDYTNGNFKIKPEFLDRAELLAKSGKMLTLTSCYIHLVDQLLWKQISGQELLATEQDILNLLAQSYGVKPMELLNELELPLGPDVEYRAKQEVEARVKNYVTETTEIAPTEAEKHLVEHCLNKWKEQFLAIAEFIGKIQ